LECSGRMGGMLRWPRSYAEVYVDVPYAITKCPPTYTLFTSKNIH
jgi:hypothetical protein